MLSLSAAQHSLRGEIALPSSKSESNRALIIQALAGTGIELHNLSSARDTQTMMRLLAQAQPGATLDVLDAGTTMRFLTAYCAIKGLTGAVLTGTPRMQERPIGILVEALRALGADISYMKQEGFPPIQINSFSQRRRDIAVRGDVSSQYISALLMAGPALPMGLELELLGEVGSRPYIEMTLQLMGHFGVSPIWEGNRILVPAKPYQAASYSIESDWSGASYWYSLASLSHECELTLLGLRENSLQGDIAVSQFMEKLGVSTYFSPQGAHLRKTKTEKVFEYDFSDCPDLAQTVAVLCTAKGVDARLHGLKSLRIKETDRIAALQQELLKCGVRAEAIGDESLLIAPQTFQMPTQPISTYHDHRMAMAFAPLALLGGLQIEHPEVVNKSYPTFWRDLSQVGIVSC